MHRSGVRLPSTPPVTAARRIAPAGRVRSRRAATPGSWRRRLAAMSRAVHAVVLVPLLVLALLAACSEPAGTPKPALVFAAASLAAPFQAIAADFEEQHPG